MEKYYDAIEEKYQDMEFAIESIIYENELKYTYAMEAGENKDDASVASVGSNKEDSTVKNVSNNFDSAGRNMDNARNETNQQQRDQDTTQRQASGNDNPRIKQEVINNIKQISEKVSQFIREHIANLSSTMSLMLKDSAGTENELNRILNTRKANLNVIVTDYAYNDKFISEFDSAVSGAFSDYLKQYTTNLPKLGEVVQLIANGDMEKAKSYLKSANLKDDSNTSAPTDIDSTTAAPDTIHFIRPCEFVAKRLKVDKDKIGDLNPTNIKKYAYEHCKGTSAENNKPKKMLLKNNEYILNNSITFIQNYKTELRKLNTNKDNLTKCANNYQTVCKDIQSMQSIDESLKNLINRVLTTLSSHINELVALNNFSLTILKERAISSEIIIRTAYTGKAELTSAKSNNTDNVNNENNANNTQNNEERGNTQ